MRPLHYSSTPNEVAASPESSLAATPYGNAPSSTFTLERADALAIQSEVSLAKLRMVLWAIALALGGIDAWHGRFWMNADGISYLDLGDAYLKGDWLMIANAYWSPLYAWLLALGRVVSGASPYSEFTVVSIVNFAIYLGALASFHFLLTGIIRYKRSQEAKNGHLYLPEWVCLTLGYAIFVWSSLSVISLKVASPDLCVAAFVYLICGYLLRIRMGDTRYRTFVLLGFLLGVGYLAKAPLFPLAFVFLTVAALLVGNLRAGIKRASLAFVVFLIVSAPLVVILSVAKGRLTFGDSGKLNYAWLVNGVTYRHWQGENPGSGTPLHPTRKISNAPAIFEFGSPLAATYPLWYDPSYWYDGVTVRFNLKQQLRPIMTGMKVYYGAFFNLHIHKQFQNNTLGTLFSPLLVIGLFILLLLGRQDWRVIPNISRFWFLIVPALAGLGMYLLVYVEPRHVAPFPVLLYLAFFAGIRPPEQKNMRRLMNTLIVVVALSFLVFFGISTFRTPVPPNLDWQVAQGLSEMGLKPGDKVAALRYANAAHARWARLAQVQIVAEMFTTAFREDEDEFWRADEPTRKKTIETFIGVGADVIVANRIPTGSVIDGWKRVGDTNYYAYFLRKPDSVVTKAGR